MVSAIERVLDERVRDTGIERERKPAERIFVTAVFQYTGLGDTLETFDGLVNGRSSIKEIDVENPYTKIGGPLNYKSDDHFSKKEQRRWAIQTQLAVLMVRNLTASARIPTDEKGRVKDNPDFFACCIGSGVGPELNLIDIDRIIFQSIGDDGKILSPEEAIIKFLNLFHALKSFPQQINGEAAAAIGASGWGMSDIGACATGAQNIVEAARLIREGKAEKAIAGGVEDVLSRHAAITVGAFSVFPKGVFSRRNDEPEKASRPFDRDRDGFTIASGVGGMLLERGDEALARGAPIHAELVGFEKSLDAKHPTSLDVDRVAKTIAQALWDEKAQDFMEIDAIYAHATATPGDVDERTALKKAFGDEKIFGIPITAIKSNLGHTLGAAGAINAVNAVLSIIYGVVPPIRNLENVDPKLEGPNYLREAYRGIIRSVLCNAFGFNGHNAVLVFKDPNARILPLHQAGEILRGGFFE